MSNRPVQSQDISGLRVTGAGTTITTIIIGSRASGSLRRESVYFGPRDGGVGTTALTRLTRVTGDPHVGFYGGVNYGYGYTGNGYWGGRWSGNNFQYNTAVTHVNKTVINNTYVNNSFAKNVNANRTSFNGGNGGIKAQANAEQRAAMANAKKEGPTSQQLERQKLASKDQNLRASVNKGKPNQEAIKSFNKNEGAGQGKGAQGLEAAGGAAGAGAGNKPGNVNERNLQGAGAGKAENQTGTS